MKKLTRKWFRQAIALMLIVCMVCSNGMLALADEAVASTMRLARTEGTVTVTNKNGRDMGTMADMKLFSGYQMATAQSSYAWITLDDSKLIKLDAVSEAEIQKKGKDLEVLLNSGNLFFNVTESLKSDETLNIRTSTMVTGIRGTSGWVKVIDSWRTRVYILEGQVECWVMDPVSGQYKGVTLRGGQYAEFVVYDQTREGDKCDIITNNYTENDIDGFVAVELMNDPELREKIKGATGFNVDRIAGNAPNKLNQDQQDVNQKVQAINEQVKQQDNNVSKNPLFSDRSARENSGGSGSGGSGSSGGGSSSSGGSSGTTTPDDSTSTEDTTDTTNPDNELTEITLSVTEAETDDMLNYYLALPNMVTVTVEPSDTDSTLNITTATTVSSTQNLVLSGVNLDVASGVELRINGTLTTDGSVVNNGVISNTSMNSFVIGGTLTNAAGASIDNTGKIQTTGGLTNSGSLVSTGRLIGAVTVADGGIFELQTDGTYGTLEGTLTVETNGYAALYKETPTGLVIDGGELEVCGEAALTSVALADGTLTVSAGGSVETVTVTGGQVNVAGGTVKTVTATDGQVNVDGGSVTTLDWSKPLTGTGTVVVPTAVTIKNGTVGTVSTDGGILDISGGTVTTATTKTVAEISGGNVATLVADSALISVYGGNVESVSSTSGGQVKVIGGSITDAVLNDTKFIMTAGSVDTVDMTYTEDNDIIISGGTLGDVTITSTVTSTNPDGAGTMYPIFSIEDSGETQVVIDSVELNGLVSYRMAGGTVGELTTECTVDIDYGVVDTLNIAGSDIVIGGDNATDENTKVTEVVATNGTIEVNAGTHGSIELNNSEGTVSGGTINGGIVVSGEAATLTVEDGVVNAPKGGAAIEVTVPVEVDENGYGYPTTDYNVTLSGGIINGGDDIAIQANAGYISIADTATVKAKTIDGLVQTNNTGVWVDVPWLETNGGISTDIVNAQFLICSESASEYTLQKATSDLSEAVYLADSGDVIAVITEEADAVSYDSGNEITVEENESFTIDLNDNTLNLNTLLTINYAETDGAVGGSLEIIDSVGGGMFVVNEYGYFTNGGNLTFTDVNTEFYGENNSYNTLVIDGGEHLFHSPIRASQLTREDGIKIIDEISNITVTGGARLESGVKFIKGMFGEENASVFTTSLEGVITLGESGEDPVTLAVTNDATYYYNSFVDMLFGTLNLVNVEGDLGECAAVLVRGSEDATSTGNACITVGAGADIKSSNEKGTLLFYDIVEISFNGGSIYNDSDDGAVIYTGYNFNNGLFSSSELKTGLYGKNFIVSGYGAEGYVEYNYSVDGYMKSTDTVDGYYYLEKITGQSLAVAAQIPSSTQITATSSSATATDSDADGGSTPLTTSPAAIPMAAAAFALMAAVYQVVEDEKKRKER